MIILTQSEVQAAPPDNLTADTSTFSPAAAPGLLALATLTTSVQARTEAAVACDPGGGELANSHIESALPRSPRPALASGEPGGASVTYTPGTVTVTVGTTTTTPVDLGDSQFLHPHHTASGR